VLENETSPSDNPWKSDFKQGLFNMTTKKSLFKSFEFLTSDGFTLRGTTFSKNEKVFKPLYEAKLTSQFNHRHGSFEGVSEDQRFGTRAQTNKPDVVLLQDPTWQPRPRYWVDQTEIEATIPNGWERSWFMGFRNAISAVADARSVAFAVIPRVGVGNSMPLLFLDEQSFDCLTAFACFNSFALDYVARQKAAGGNLNFYVMKQLPILPPETFASESAVISRQWISSRVLELTYTAWDLEAFALDCGYSGPPFRWDEERRFQLRCELDAAYFHLYLGTPAEWGADSPQLREMFPTPRDAVDYIMETFPIVKRKDIKRTEAKNDSDEVTTEGTYITKDTILTIYDEMAESIANGATWESPLDPPPADPRAAHSAERTEALPQ